jgi:hypothetical protein
VGLPGKQKYIPRALGVVKTSGLSLHKYNRYKMPNYTNEGSQTNTAISIIETVIKKSNAGVKKVNNDINSGRRCDFHLLWTTSQRSKDAGGVHWRLAESYNLG